MALRDRTARRMGGLGLLGVLLVGLIACWPALTRSLFYDVHQIDARPPEAVGGDYRYFVVRARRYPWYPGAEEREAALSVERFWDLYRNGVPVRSYFPPPLDNQHHDFTLKAVQEPPLVAERPGVVRAYRLLYMPSFGDGFTIRVEERLGAGWWVVARSLGSPRNPLLGPGGERDEALSAEKAGHLLEALERHSFFEWGSLGVRGPGGEQQDTALLVLEAQLPDHYLVTQTEGGRKLTGVFLDALRP